MALEVFPREPITRPSFSVKRRPTYKATILRAGKHNQREVSSYQMAIPSWEFELTYELLRDLSWNSIQDTTSLGYYRELSAVLELYLRVGGQFGEFLFDDWGDNSRDGQVLGYGTGSKVDFKFVRTIDGANGLNFTEAVGAVNLDHTIRVYLNNELIDPTMWAVSEDLTTLLFVNPPARNALVTSSFYFYYKCRFKSDRQEVEEFFSKRWSINSLKFESVPDVSITNPLDPFPGATDDDTAGATCLTDFQWFYRVADSGAIVYDTTAGARGTDIYGNMYILEYGGGPTRVFRGDGTGEVDYYQADFADMVDGYYGFPVVDRTHSPSIIPGRGGCVCDPIYGGQYVLVHLAAGYSGSAFSFWWLICQPHADGTLTCLGAIRYIGLLDPPYVNGTNVLGIANTQTTRDPILVLAYAFLAGTHATIIVLPSINDIITGKYKAASPGRVAGQVPSTIIWPLVDTDTFSDCLFIYSADDKPRPSGFVLPNSSGGTTLYMYAGRSYMDHIAGLTHFANVTYQTVLQPEYPYGCIIKLDLGKLDYATLSTTPIGTSTHYFGTGVYSYTVDNANWVDQAGTPQIPFGDEYTYISNGAVGGTDDYAMVPWGIFRRNSDKWWVFMGMAGVRDARDNYDNDTAWATLRLFEYTPSTNKAIQIFKKSCILYQNGQVPYNVTPFITWFNNYQGVNLYESGGEVTVALTSMIYKTLFIKFQDPN